MRIAVIGPTYPLRGGISQYTTLMVENLRRRHDVMFISFEKQYPQLLFPGRTQKDESAERIEADNEPILSFSSPLSWRKAARRACEFNPRLVIFSWVNPALALHFRYISGYIKHRLPRCRIVFWCHNVVQHEHRSLGKLLSRIAFGRADHFMVTGRELERELLSLMQGVAVSVVPLPILDVFPSTPFRAEARSGLGLTEEDRVVLYFGFVRPYKGLINLLGAIPEAVRRIPSLRLLVVGEFWEEMEQYSREIERSGIDRYVTVVDSYVPNEDVPRYFNSADLVVLPYTSASASGIVKIAYAFGKPVITTTVGALPESVDDGRTGYLVPPGDPSAIARAIIEFFEQGRAGEFGRNVEEYRRRFSWERFSEVVESIGRIS
ncbi:MAG: glycosyltransferase [Actinobacteria bacterium]|nr:glycosyltransferase [Actinomycetota bacterium]MCG2817451.1 glycosyltransferase [Actinomycetes bacterium]MBU4217934.1 glycosyltransferase [Actinomycetota bacterium]MBU4360033.1 glycosyltransferase [Actinomycetota bacterium]MBU4392997.1 glycosyltransferase [Actinomycetota bacterium]